MQARLEDKYREKRGCVVGREKYLRCAVENLTPFRAVRSRVEAGSRERVEGIDTGSEPVFDYVLVYNGRPIAYVDITSADCHKPYIQIGRLEHARKHNALDRLWIVWSDEKKLILYFINGKRALDIEGELVWIDGEPAPYKLVPLDKWILWRRWIKILVLQTALSM